MEKRELGVEYCSGVAVLIGGRLFDFLAKFNQYAIGTLWV